MEGYDIDGFLLALSSESADNENGPFDVSALLSRYCESDYACQVSLLKAGADNFKKEHDYLPALLLAEQLEKVATERSDDSNLLIALSDQSHLLNFLHDRENTRLVFARMAALYERTGDAGQSYYFQTLVLEGDVFYAEDPSPAITQIENLWRQAEDEGYEEQANNILTRLKYIYEEFGMFDRLEVAVKKLEEIIAATPANVQSPYRLPAYSGRGDLQRRFGDYQAAERSYQTGLQFVRLHDDEFGQPWSQGYLLLRLAHLEWEQHQQEQAVNYLDTVLYLGTTYQLEDLLSQQYELRIEIAESAGDYATALAYTREQSAHQQTIDSAEASFDLRRQNLQFAVDQLEAERQNQELELALARNNSRNYLLLGGLLGLLTLLLGAGFYYQRRSKKQLAEKNTLIQQQANRLLRLDETKSRFFANVSHELRTPLSLLTGPVDTLLRDPDNLTTKQRELLRTAATGGVNLSTLIQKILDLGRLEAHKVTAHPVSTRLKYYFQTHLQSFQPLAEQHRIDYSYTVEVPENRLAEIDPELVRQILSNLISNSLKFTPPGERVSVTARLTDGRLCLRVADTGPGVHPEDRPRIFERFYQSEQANAAVAGGTGIGLALVREYTHLFQGEVAVTDTPGGGATFTVSFPVVYVDSPPPTPVLVSEGATSEFQSNGATLPCVVVVEDNVSLRAYLVTELEQFYRVKDFPNGADAWAFIQRDPQAVNLVLSDYMMPVMDGFQLLQRCKEHSPTAGIPFVLLTARAEPEDRLSALRVGVDDYLIKPFTTPELRTHLDALLGHLNTRESNLTEEDNDTALPRVQSKEERAWLEELETYVKANLHDSQLKVGSLSKAFLMSDSALLRQVKRLTGLTIQQYITELRLATARRLLETRAVVSARKAGEAVGYANVGSFNRRFKQRYGRLPSDLLVERVNK
ncbi:hypothetical protein A3850_008965 [Lewinella sp. 4G2]|nr:hypothetical protein A3850_008965 [Lewinella sp. 4G2]